MTSPNRNDFLFPINKDGLIIASLEKFKLGKDYPFPIVRHEDARAKALNAFKKI